MIELYKQKCTGCRACEKLCPKNAIKMVENEKGFLYPCIDKEKCVECEICKLKCPINNKENENKKEVYAAYNKDEKTRKNSSSGGLFTLFAEYIIENQGIVFGAAFDKDFKVEHIYITQKEEIEKLRCSKYVQSDTKNTYVQAKEFLEQGKLVYYSGTPCQIEGLYAYLTKKYDNLITQDIICHGVPSPKIWESYLKYKNKKFESINFRSKENATWQDFELNFKYKNGEENVHHDKETYMRLFLKDVILRESCYDCSFKKQNRNSDILLADFWGIDNVDKEFNDKKGVSLLIVNSKKGKKLVEKLSDKMIKKEVPFAEAIALNPSMLKSAKKHSSYEKVFKKLDEGKIEEIFDNIEKIV